MKAARECRSDVAVPPAMPGVDMSGAESTASWVPLTPRERRVLGVLVEKAKTTPEYYPLSVAAIVTGCNQKSNRDPVTNYDQDDVEETLHSLRKKGAVILVEGGGRVARWKHTLYDWLKVSKVELAVMAELLLRGPQTEGELRGRASRMEPLADLPALAGDPRGPGAAGPGAVSLAAGPEAGRVRGARALSPRRAREGPPGVLPAGTASDDETPARLSTARVDLAAAPVAPAWATEIAALRAEVDSCGEPLDALANEVRELKSALGV